ncbi:hypothetical protein SAMN05216410_0774 [Sanguibacter gelidistatuariae]|uniref:Uncharacterized protein n=1 Tax=Sanguibacter gelidistatuariae TaxID=1814289 RepID=A0A1G6H631_9MICO|nr:hypothetical protein [Sanguibacter gelidistatuariae]SDB89737.1 hypothetical protein SAMN05216410_0774 [Sanguibacter gelidistatuariae]
MRIHWGWLTATFAALVFTVLVFGYRSGSCASSVDGTFIDDCQSGPIGGYPAMVVLVTVGLALTVFFGRRAVRRGPE